MVTAVFEGATGIALLLAPTGVFALLFSGRAIGPDIALMGRVAGVAVLGLGVASWLARGHGGGRTQRRMLRGLLVYNVAASVALAFVGIILNMTGILLWPAVLFHVALTAWTMYRLREPHDAE